MDLHDVLLVLFVFTLLLGNNRIGGRSLSEEEDLELEKQLELLNKPAVKTILTKHGDIYDCVDFYKQPAFDHHLLKDHSFHFQMKPTYLSDRTSDKNSTKVNKFQFRRLGCPVGTVPISRITKEDLIRERFASKIIWPNPDFAVVRTTSDGPKQLTAAGAIVSVYNPKNVGTLSYSAARLKVQNGPDSIEAGWRVDPSLYGDSRTRFYIRFDAGQTHCFNTMCPGFVYVDTDIAIDYLFDKTSQTGGPFIEVEIWLKRDTNDGNWWLELGPDNVQIGFWPKVLFSGLADLASNAEWGGEVFSPPNTIKPQMGAGGTNLAEDTAYDAYFSRLSLITADGQTVDANYIEESVNDLKYYDVKNEGNTGGAFRCLALYGGSGEPR